MQSESKQHGYVQVHAEHTCTTRRIRVLCGLAVAMVIISVLGVVAFLALVYQGKGAACNESDQKKVNISCPLKGPDALGDYEIFTANKTATYLIYGEVRCLEDHQDWIDLQHSWKGGEPLTIHRKKHRYSDAYILGENEVKQNSKVYLRFNMGQPNCNRTVFRVYEL